VILNNIKIKDVFTSDNPKRSDIVTILNSINATDYAKPNFIFNTDPDKGDSKSSLTIPYINHDNKWYWVLFLIHTNQDDNTSTGNGLTVMWSTSEQNPVGKDFTLIKGQTRFCNKYSNLNFIDFNYNIGNWCCTNNQGGVNGKCVASPETPAGAGGKKTILDHCCLSVCASDLTNYYQVPMQTTKGDNPGSHHPNSEGNKGCDHDCHTKKSDNLGLILGLSLGLGIPFLIALSLYPPIYRMYKKK